MTLEGIDVSHYQSATPSLVSLSFLIAKATEGTTPDEKFDQHITKGKNAGLIVGAYHFGRSDVDIERQALTFLARAGTHSIEWLAIDVEGAHAPSVAQTRTFINVVHASGHRCGLYHSDSGFFDAGQDWDWVADWSARPGRPWDIWQYRGSPLDLDRFEGSTEELRTLAGETMPPIKVGSQHSTPFTVSLIVGDQIYDEAKRPLEVVKTARVADGLFPTGDGWQAIVYDATSDSIGPRLALVKTDTVAARIHTVPAVDVLSAKQSGYDLAVGGAKIGFPPRPS